MAVCITTEHAVQESSEDNLRARSWILAAEEHVVTRADCQRHGSRCCNLLRCICGVRQVTTWKCWGASYCVASAAHKTVDITALVADLATKSLLSDKKLLSARYGIDLRPTQSLLFHKRGGRILFQICGRRDYLEIRMTERPLEINAITLDNVKREGESFTSKMPALRRGHLTATVARAPWSLEEKRRHETNSRVEHDDRCEICVKTRCISRHPRRVYSESCAFDYESGSRKRLRQ